MKHLLKYSKYKPSGVAWLGDVPDYWEVKRLRFLARLNPSKREHSLNDEAEVSFVPMEAISENGSLNLEQTRVVSEVMSGYTYFSENDVCFAKITPCFENGKGAIMQNLIGGCGFGTTELTVLRCLEKLDKKYLFYVTKSSVFRTNGEAWMYGAGGQKRVPDEFVKEYLIALPPQTEQRAISEFLDRETGKIDDLIGKRERLIALLQEKRAAVISHAVTKGLDPNVKLKPSGIDWLGDIPEHWEVKTLKSVAKVKTGFAFSSDDYEDDGIPLIRISDILADGTVDIENTKYLPGFFKDLYSDFILREKDIIMAMTGATIGKVGRYNVPSQALLNQRVCKFFSTKMDQEFLWFILNSNQYYEYIKLTGFGGAQPNISDNQLLNFIVALPTKEEQRAISSYLICTIKKISVLIDKENQIIDKLREYRTSLISAAVTGKIDVRGKG